MKRLRQQRCRLRLVIAATTSLLLVLYLCIWMHFLLLSSSSSSTSSSSTLQSLSDGKQHHRHQHHTISSASEYHLGHSWTLRNKEVPSVVSPNGDGTEDFHESDKLSYSSLSSRTLFSPFPRWGFPERGIDINAILIYLEMMSGRKNELLLSWTRTESFKDDTVDKRYPISNRFYVFGGSGLYRQQHQHVWTWIPPHHKDDHIASVSSRIPIMDSFFVLALQRLLLQQHSSDTDGTNIKSSNWPRLRQHLENSSGTGGIPMVVSFSDYRRCSFHNLQGNTRNYSLPLFAFCGAYDPAVCNHSFVLPTYATLQRAKATSHDWTRVFEQQTLQYPLDHDNNTKKNKNSTKLLQAVWRGSTTGYPTLHRSRRFQMVRQANRLGNPHRDLFDVGYIRQGRLKSSFHLRPYKNMADFQRYWMVLDVDGNSWSERLGALFCQNSAVLRVEPEYVDHFYFDGLIPNVHYIPVDGNSTDLVDVVRRLVLEAKHDNKTHLKNVIQNAQEWCSQHFVHEALLRFFLDTMEAYVSLLDQHDAKWSDRWQRAFWKESTLPWKQVTRQQSFWPDYDATVAKREQDAIRT